MARAEQVTRDLIGHGTHTCAGCAGSMAVRQIIAGLNTDDVIVETSCVCAGGASLWTTLPTICLMFSNTASVASGVSAALHALKRTSTTVVAFGGDGGTADIGLSAVSGAAERDDDMIYVCLDNEAYMNTGMQKSGTTPMGAATSTTPSGKATKKKNLPLIMAHHSVSYVATVSVAFPRDLSLKVKKAAAIRGFRYIHVNVPCPTGWGFPPDRTAEIARLAVESGVWPLYEIDRGRLALTHRPKTLKPVSAYLAAQERFRAVKDAQAIEFGADAVALYDKLSRGEW